MCFAYNTFAVTCALLLNAAVWSWLVANFIAACGIPGAWHLWYRRLYDSARGESTLSIMPFLINYGMHVAFCGFTVILPGGFATFALTGLQATVSAFGVSSLLGIIYLVGAALWTLETALSALTLCSAYRCLSRGNGVHTLDWLFPR